MTDHYDEFKKPFRVGDLVRDTAELNYGPFALVLRIEWDFSWQSWEILLLFQSDGRKRWATSTDFEPAGKSK